MKAPERIDTARLDLRLAMDSDVPSIFQYASDPDVTAHLVWRRVTEPRQVREHLAKCRRNWENGSEYTWFIADRSNDQVIGSVATRIRGVEAEIGFVLGRSWWNRGYMTEAAGAVVIWLESLPTIERISATCDTENYRSARVLEKLGLMRIGSASGGMVRPNISELARDTHIYAKRRTPV